MQIISLNEQTVIEIINSKQESYKLAFSYNYNRQGWFIDIVSDSFKIYGLRITCNSNILRQWKDKLGFGIAIEAENDLEPFFQEDFLTERAKIYLLEPSDLEDQDNLLKGMINEQY